MNNNYIRPGGVAVDLPAGWRADVREILDMLPEKLGEYDDLLENNPIWLERTQGVGVITPEECRAYGITGPTLRSTGVEWDLRKAFPYSGIEEYDFDIPTGTRGDVYDRYRIRVEEIKESMRIVEQAMERMPKGDYRIDDRKITPPPRGRIDESMEALIHHFKIFTEGFTVPAGETYVAVESPSPPSPPSTPSWATSTAESTRGTIPLKPPDGMPTRRVARPAASIPGLLRVEAGSSLQGRELFVPSLGGQSAL